MVCGESTTSALAGAASAKASPKAINPAVTPKRLIKINS